MKHKQHPPILPPEAKPRFALFHAFVMGALVVFLLLAVSACQVMGEPPRVATATARAELTPTATPEPLVLSLANATLVAQAATPLPGADPNPALTVWMNETSPEHETAVREIAAGFSQTAGVDVAVRFVDPALLPKLVETAVLSDTYDLPDVIFHPLAYTVGWAERGILNASAADAAIEQIGRDTFDPAALALVAVNGQTAALPSDGYHQILLYRQDWFDERNLATPDNYAAMLAAAEAIYNRDELRSGFVIPTESNLITTHQAFEHLAVANGCQLISTEGEVLLLEPACREALNFYYDIVHQFSPIGVQTDTSARDAFLEGRTGMIMASPRMLPMLAGLHPDYRPACAECAANPEHLAENSGIITVLQGADETSAGYSEVTYLGITREADEATAVAFADYWFNEGYETWLAVESERKVPMRLGDSTTPDRFIGAWGTQPLAGSDRSLTDIFGPEVVTRLRDGVADSARWGFLQGQGGVIASLYEDLTFSIVLQEMLSGYFNTEKTLYQAYNRVIEQIPDYTFPVLQEPTPEPTPENE